MDALKTAVVGMGVLIVAMLALLVFGLSRRPPPHPPLAGTIVLDEPAGTRIASIAPAGPSVAVLLQGGGPDRIVLLNGAGQVVGHVSLSAK